MPPTRYQGYRDPYAGSIADIILRRGDIAARGAENIGAIQARAAETRGNAWAGAANTIASLAQGIPLQIERQREQAAVNRERQARTTAVEQRTTREANAETFAQKGEAFIQQALQESRTADGDPDFDAVAKKLELSPFHKAADGFRAKAEKNKKGLAEAKALAETVATKTAELQARIVAEATDPDDFASDLGFYISAGRIDPETAAATIKAARSAPDWKAFQQEIIADSPEFQAQQLKIRETEADIALKEADKELKDAMRAGTLPATPAEKETERHNKEMEAIGRMTAGRQAAANAETTRHNKAMEDLQKNKAISLAPDMPSAYQTAIDRAIMSIPAIRRGTVVQTANRLFAEGDGAGLKDMIRQAAIESEPVDVRNQIVGRMATLASIRDARNILEQMEAKGVPTNILVGTAEDVARKLGTSTNPEYVTLANRLMSTLINYRRAATGVQFSQREQEQYARMFPDYKNTLPVNRALIEGLEREIETYDKTYWEHKLGPDGANLIGMAPDATADGWIDLGNGVRVREKQR